MYVAEPLPNVISPPIACSCMGMRLWDMICCTPPPPSPVYPTNYIEVHGNLLNISHSLLHILMGPPTPPLSTHPEILICHVLKKIKIKNLKR